MIIKEPSSRWGGLRALMEGRLAGIVLVFSALTGAVFLGGYLNYYYSWVPQLFSWLEAPVKTSVRMIRAEMTPIETIRLDVGFRDYQRIAYQRRKAIARKTHSSHPDNWVPVSLQYGGAQVTGRMQLAGSRADHWADREKWSLKVFLDGDSALAGMNKFMLVNPAARGYWREWLYQRLLEREGFLFKRIDAVGVSINGKALGVYLLEEDYDDLLVRNNRRPKGPIVYFKRWSFGKLKNPEPVRGWVPLLTPTEPRYFVKPVYATDVGDPDHESHARSLLEGLRRGDVALSDAFDVDSLARFVALRVVLSSGELDYRDLRFYFNPVTAKLEPIGAELHFRYPRDAERVWWLNLTGGSHEAFHDLFFTDQEFLEAYYRELEKGIQNGYMEGLLASVSEELNELQLRLSRDTPFIDMDTSVFLEQRKYIARRLYPAKSFHAGLEESSPGRLQLALTNATLWPCRILHVSYRDQILELAAGDPILPSHAPGTPMEERIFTFRAPPGLELGPEEAADLRVHHRYLGGSTDRVEGVFGWSFMDHRILDLPITDQKSHFAGEFLIKEPSSRRVTFRVGTWQVRAPVIIPPDWKVHVPAGVELEFSDGAFLLSYSPIQMAGNEDAPVVISASDGRSGGVAVLTAASESVFEHVRFERLSSPASGHWGLLGAVTFYDAAARLADCLFSGTEAERALDVVRSSIEVSRSTFTDTAGEHLHARASRVGIRECAFLRAASDALHFEESVVKLARSRVAGGEAAGVVLGDRSVGTILGVSIDGVDGAVTIKNGSRGHLAGSEIRRCNAGVIAFRDSANFAPPEIVILDSQIAETVSPFRIEEGTGLSIEDLERREAVRR